MICIQRSMKKTQRLVLDDLAETLVTSPLALFRAIAELAEVDDAALLEEMSAQVVLP